MFSKIVEQSIKNGFFDEVTEDVLNDKEQFNTMVDVFIICPRNKRYNPSSKTCVRVSGKDRVKKKRAMKRAWMKKRGKKAMMVRKRRKSLRKRKAMGIK